MRGTWAGSATVAASFAAVALLLYAQSSRGSVGLRSGVARLIASVPDKIAIFGSVTPSEPMPTMYASRQIDNGAAVASASIYPFLAMSGSLLVEPHVETNLTVRGASSDVMNDPDKWFWEIAQNNNFGESSAELREGEYVGRYGSVSVVVTLKAIGSYTASARYLGDVSRHVAAEATLVCRYVRRSIRALSEDERARYFDAFAAMLSQNGTQGRRAYGGAFLSVPELAAVHLREAGLRLGDHMHDGVGFLTQHLALTSAFEQAVQSVDKSLAVPFWDFTEDSARFETLAEMFDPRTNEIWRSDWFGSATGQSHTVTEGRFAYQVVPSAASARSSLANAYGFLRAPWNVNKSPFVTRSHAFCDATFQVSDWPSCASHRDLVFGSEYEEWSSYASAASYAPHGGVHFMIGGYDNCGDVHAKLDAEITAAAVDSLELAMLQVPKNLWRNMLAEAPTFCAQDAPQAECHLRCNEDAANASFGRKVFFSRGMARDFGSWIDDLPQERYAAVLTVLCETPWSPGEQVEASSPLDVSFWPIHPALDRLTQYRRLVRPFASSEGDARWLADDARGYCSTPKEGFDCEGHHPWDLTAFQTTYHDADSDTFVQRYATNGELFDYSNPHEYRLPYVYDDFDWVHCEKQGSHFPKPWKAHNADAPPPGSAQN